MLRGSLARLAGGALATGDQPDASAIHPLEFFRAVEVQDRGALHLHVIVWSAAPLDVDQVHELAVRAGFGCVLDLQAIDTNRRAAHARYVAKYATKASDQRADVPWARIVQVLDEETGELVELVNPDPTYRTWSASRHFGLTLRQIREALRAKIARAADAGSTVPAEPATCPPPADLPEPAD